MAEAKTAPPTEEQLAKAALEKVRKVFRGNGIKGDSIQILSQKITRHTLNAGTYLELKPVITERVVPGKTIAGVLVASKDEASKQVDQAMVTAANNPAFKAQVANVLLSRPDQGFGLNRQAVNLDFLKKEFTWHEGCNTCHGTTHAHCPKCQGRRIETCIKCTGRGLMPCPLCRTTGLLQGVKCTRCLGHRYVACDGCQRSGMMPCRTCNATGHTRCPTCNGQGWKSHVLMLAAQALTYFEYDPKSLPKGAADMIEMHGANLAGDGRITLKGRIADDRENVLGASYEVDFPYGEIVFSIGKKEVKANMFGHKAEITEFPLILDKILAPAVEDLEDAAADVGSVAGKIKGATRYRLIAQAFLTVSRSNVKKTAAFLMKTYDIGLSQGMAEKIAVLADSTTAHITRKPRYHGLFMGLAAISVMMGVYYLLPVRAALSGILPNVKFDAVLDILPIILGCVFTTMAIQMAAAGAMQKALGHLSAKDQKKPPQAKAGNLGLWGYAGVVILALLMIEATVHKGAQTPFWYGSLRNAVIPTAPPPVQ